MKKSKVISAVLAASAAISAMTMSVSATPTDYAFTSGFYEFGNATSTDYPVAKDDSLLNIRRNKDVTLLPPAYGVFSGNIPSGQTSPYHELQYEEESFSNFPGGTSTMGTSTNFPDSGSGEFLASTSMLQPDSTAKLTASYNSAVSEPVYTEPMYMNDGSIGTLKVPSLGKTVKVYEDTTAENMRMGLGRFTYTSAWDGNVGIAGHNRGNYAFFSFLKDLKKGDKVTYTTGYGTRDYKVSGIYTISVDDTSYLGWSAENQLTMITCIADQPNVRLCVVAEEIS